MFAKIRWIAVLGALVAILSIAGTPATSAAAGGCGTTLKETLSGPAINGMTPQGEAQSDESQFLCGGDTIMTVQIKNVNLADGTVLNVSLDFTPIGTITLSRQQGTLVTNLGHFGVSRDQIVVSNGGTTILSGGSFH